jgi:hypothetical protein
VDVSTFKVGDWLLVAGGAVMLIFGVALDWVTADTIIGEVSGGNAFDFFFTGGLAYVLVVAAGVVTFLLAGDLIKADHVPWPLVLLGATGVATLLMLVRLLLGSGHDGIDRGAGMFVAFLAAAMALAGAVLNFTASGGRFKDLTDLDKLKRAFGGTTRTAPPPPPPPPPTGGSIPPPPPPPAP